MATTIPVCISDYALHTGVPWCGRPLRVMGIQLPRSPQADTMDVGVSPASSIIDLTTTEHCAGNDMSLEVSKGV